MKFAAFILGLVILQGGCHPAKDLFVQDDVRGVFSFHSKISSNSKSPQVFWRDNHSAIGFSDNQVRDNFRTSMKDEKLVMVSFAYGSYLSWYSRQLPETLLHHPGAQNRQGYAMVRLKNDQQHYELAHMAHQGKGLTCGNIQLLDFQLLVQSSNHYEPVYEEHVKLADVATMLETPNKDKIKAGISRLEALETRFHSTSSGQNAPEEIKTMIEEANQDRIAGLTIELYDHGSKTPQKSVVVAIPGQTDDDTTVIIGAHLDSIVSGGSSTMAPGADDDASGIATIVEIVRTLAVAGAQFNRRVEFHGYAAEEVGLIGSADIARAYKSADRKVAAMMQFDMNAWTADGTDKIYLVTNNTSSVLRRSVKDIMNSYMGGNYEEKELPAGRSDHESWTSRGFPAVFPFEDPTDYNGALHTPNDTSENLNKLELSQRFAQLGTAFIAHQAGLVAAESEYASAITTTTNALTGDMKVAVIENESIKDAFHITVATDESVVGVEVCQTDGAGSQDCKANHAVLELGQTSNERAYFIHQVPIPIASGDHYAILGYDADEKLIAWRPIQLD